MPSSVMRSIRISGQSVIVAIRATTGRFSLSTTARALMDLNVSGASCILQHLPFGRRIDNATAVGAPRPQPDAAQGGPTALNANTRLALSPSQFVRLISQKFT